MDSRDLNLIARAAYDGNYENAIKILLKVVEQLRTEINELKNKDSQESIEIAKPMIEVELVKEANERTTIEDQLTGLDLNIEFVKMRFERHKKILEDKLAKLTEAYEESTNSLLNQRKELEKRLLSEEK